MEKSCDSIWTSQENLLKQLFIVDIGENKCVTHDGSAEFDSKLRGCNKLEDK